jgi:hypothetical protein
LLFAWRWTLQIKPMPAIAISGNANLESDEANHFLIFICGDSLDFSTICRSWIGCVSGFGGRSIMAQRAANVANTARFALLFFP